MLTEATRLRRALVRAGLLGCALMAAIVVSSAYLRLQTIGIGCEDWPGCYGRVASPAAGDGAKPVQSAPVTVARLLHRASAMLVALVVAFVLLSSLTRAGRSATNVSVAVALCILTGVLAVIGRASAGTLVPAIGVANLAGGFSMLALFWVLVLHNAGARHEAGSRRRSVRAAVYALGLLLAAHVAIGALVSVTYSAPLCDGPLRCRDSSDGVLASLARLDPGAALAVDASNRVVAPAGGAALQLVHRTLGVGIGGMLIVLGAVLALEREARWAGAALALAALAEVALGIYLVSARFPLAAALLHNLIAAALLLLLVSLAFHAGSRRRRA